MKMPYDLLVKRNGSLTKELDLVRDRFGGGLIPKRHLASKVTKTVCGFCSTGCGLVIGDDGNGNLTTLPDPEFPVNGGTACPKGWEALTPLYSDDRACHPLMWDRKSNRKRVDWQEAARHFACRFKSILETYGPDSIACLSTGQMLTEELAFLGSFFRFGMKGRHYDSNTRQCMATSHVAYKESFGFDAPPFTYADFEESDVLILIGSNLCIAHPILWQRVLANRRNPCVIVIDPRKTETAMAATLHLALKPKSDLTLLYGLAKALMDLGLEDPQFVDKHTAGFFEFKAFVEEFTEARVLQETELSLDEWRQLVRSFAPGKRVSFWWTMGVNQSHEATRTAQAIINLALMTGNVGKPGTGANSVTGQCNAMGSRIFANATSLLGGRDFANPEDRSEVATILDIPEHHVSNRGGKAYDEIIDAILAGEIKGLWIVATNTAHSWIDQKRAKMALEKLEFLVVQDMYSTTDTAQFADLLLPAAGWGEKYGTFINSERRLGYVAKVKQAPGDALSDFNIIRILAEEWGGETWHRSWDSPEAAFDKLKKLSRGRPFDFTGIGDYSELVQSGGIQWPWNERMVVSHNGPRATKQQRRLFEDGRFFHADGRARFKFSKPRKPGEDLSSDYPLVLLTGRGSSAQWHTLTRSAKSPLLKSLSPSELYIEIHPDDASDRQILAGQRVRVKSRRGSITAWPCITSTVGKGRVFMPMHFPETNQLTCNEVDPYSRQPSYKYCAVEVETERL